ncbi:MAG: glycosyltransferase family 2 protein [Microbacteriaceae bacterium]|nr:glycosyltransferase family 2 protein [Microbacteriaceae bacterium]
MQARVTAIVVARNGATYLPRTLAALAAQTRRPDIVIAVDAGSNDASQALLADSGPTQLVTAKAMSFGSAIERALRVASPSDSDGEWLWLLAHDSAPEPRALEQLLGAVEIAPSVAIAGPKLVRLDQADVIADFGQTMTRYGASIALVDGELDQAQHDVQDDVLGVAAQGMLVRRSLFVSLGGFDPGLPTTDAGLDLSIRARLAGFRVVVVPGAKVASAGTPEIFGRRSVSRRRQARSSRMAQLHRRLVYAPPLAVPFHWLSLLPLGILRALGRLLAKQPGLVGGELSAALGAAFGGGVPAARSRLARARRLGWSAIAPLRMPPREVRERRAQAREALLPAPTGVVADTPRAGFLSNGGLWVVALAAVLGVAAFGPLLGAQTLSGGGLLPLSPTVGELWANVGYGSRSIGLGFVGSSDPFAYLVALLGSITFWAPSLSIVLLYFLSLPLAALGAWFLARRVSTRTWLPSIAALLWVVAPPFVSSLSGGHLGAIIVHLALPWLVLAAMTATRSWTGSAAAAILFAVAAASAPVLVPALLVCWFAWLVSHPASTLRLIGIPIPAIALFTPLVAAQFSAGRPLALLAEPGVPVAGGTSIAWQLALGSPGAGLNGWTALFGLPGASIAIVVAALTLPIGALALLALFVPGSRRAIPSLAVAFLGFATAVIGSRIDVAIAGGSTASIWSGAALSLFWLGLLGAAMVALDGAARAAIPFGVLAAVTAAILAVPMLGSFYIGTAQVKSVSGRILPAVVEAEAQGNPSVATLVLDPAIGSGASAGLSAGIERGSGSTLDDQSTIDATTTTLTGDARAIAIVAGNLASRSGQDATAELGRYSIGFVLLKPADGNAAIHQRTADALDGDPALASVGQTDNGLLWRVVHPTRNPAAPRVSNVGTDLGRGILIGQGVIFAITLLVGLPTTARRRRREVTGSAADDPANTFEEGDDD